MFEKENLKFISPMGDEMFHENESLIVRFSGRRGVVSTSNLSGGYRQDLRYAFNNSCGNNPLIKQKKCPGMMGKNLQEHYHNLAVKIGLPPEESTGMGTAALIENSAMASRIEHNVEVMAIATAGIDVNGGRAGDKASYDEFTRQGIKPTAGTINIFLFINAKLDGGTLTRAVVTATEAKCVAVQELMANSRYSQGIATGSGTDSIIVICNDESDVQLYNAGKHVLLGQMIGESVKEAVTKALDLQCGMNPTRQASIEWQSKRYGMTKDSIFMYYQHVIKDTDNIEEIRKTIEEMDTDQKLLVPIAAITHLCDQNRWGIIKDEMLVTTIQSMLSHLLANEGAKDINISRSRPHNHMESSPVYKQIISDTILSLAYIAHARSKRDK